MGTVLFVLDFEGELIMDVRGRGRTRGSKNKKTMRKELILRLFEQHQEALKEVLDMSDHEITMVYQCVCGS